MRYDGEKTVNFNAESNEQKKIHRPSINESTRYITVVNFSFLNILIIPPLYSYSPTIFGPDIFSAYTKKRFSVRPSVSNG